METTIFDNDIKVFYVAAKSFPDGIMEAYQKLHGLIPFSIDVNRNYFGLSRPENGVIGYKAAAEELNAGEETTIKCDTLTLKKGKYVSQTILDYAKDIKSIGCTFKELLATPGIDPEGYCVEWYFNDKDVKCMVRLEG